MRKRAFTLIELLVVIVIVGILSALLLSSIRNTLAGVRRVECANNLRQIGLAFHLYLNDHNDTFPPGGGNSGALLPFPTGSEDDGQINDGQAVASTTWQSCLYPAYVDDNRVFLCHAPETVETWSFDVGVERSISNDNPYGYNGLIGGHLSTSPDSQKRLSDIENKSETLLCADSFPYIGGFFDISESFSTPIFDINCRHSGGASILFVDGSVRFYKKNIIDENSDSWSSGDTWWSYGANP